MGAGKQLLLRFWAWSGCKRVVVLKQKPEALVTAKVELN